MVRPSAWQPEQLLHAFAEGLPLLDLIGHSAPTSVRGHVDFAAASTGWALPFAAEQIFSFHLVEARIEQSFFELEGTLAASL
jgi:hypothetical protein